MNFNLNFDSDARIWRQNTLRWRYAPSRAVRINRELKSGLKQDSNFIPRKNEILFNKCNFMPKKKLYLNAIFVSKQTLMDELLISWSVWMGHFDKGTLPKSRQSVESCSSAGDDFPTHSISTKLINGHFSQSKILRFAK